MSGGIAGFATSENQVAEPPIMHFQEEPGNECKNNTIYFITQSD